MNTQLSLKFLLNALIKYGASDLHIKPGRPPLFRINGKLVNSKMDDLSAEQAKSLIYGALNQRQIQDLERNLQVDAGFRLENVGRFRLNAFHQRGSVAGVVRMIPLTVPTLDGLGLPAVIKELSQKKRGLLLITGSTGSGKSTTLAAIIHYINTTCHHHIITFEDPIEFVHSDLKSSICQRELGSDVRDSKQALEGALRQDPNVIMMGELRDPEMIEVAVAAAETGHLVLATLHTSDAKSTLSRVVDVFPADKQNQIRVSLASSLLAIVSQRLVPRVDGGGQVAACEILIKSPSIEGYIAGDEMERIEEAMATSSTFYKMQTFNQHLEHLVEQGMVSKDDALRASNKPDELNMRLSGLKKEEGY